MLLVVLYHGTSPGMMSVGVSLRDMTVCSSFTPPRNCGGVIFLLQFVCLSVCVSVCVCVCVSVNKISAKRMHQFGCGFR